MCPAFANCVDPDLHCLPLSIGIYINNLDKQSGPSCSKLTISLVNDSLKFKSSDTQIYWNFLLKKCAKATHIFSAKNVRILYIESAKIGNEMTLNELVKLTTLWTTGPRLAYNWKWVWHLNLCSMTRVKTLHVWNLFILWNSVALDKRGYWVNI